MTTTDRGGDLTTRIQTFFNRFQRRGAQLPIAAGIPMPVATPAENELSAQAIYRQTLPSILLVHARNGRETVLGSAVAITTAAAITNCHVVMYGPGAESDPNYRYTTLMPQIMVTDPSNHEGPAKVVAAHADIDICVLQAPFPLHPIAGIEPYSVLQIGAKVYTLGNPKGLNFSFAEGIISQKRRRIDLGQGQCADIVQHTAPQSPGSSGGALLDAAGLLIGITESAIAGGENLNIAIPASLLWEKYPDGEAPKVRIQSPLYSSSNDGCS